MVTVFLYGALAEKFCPEIKLDVASPHEAVHALEANFPGQFFKEIASKTYRVVRGDTLEDGEDDLPETVALRRPNKDIHIVPAVIGGGGVVRIIAGVVLIVAGAVFSQPTLIGMGVGMALGGVVQLLSPTPDLTGLNGMESVDPRKSFLFTGAKNVTTQGGPVQVNYGEIEVGSVVISQSLTSERI